MTVVSARALFLRNENVGRREFLTSRVKARHVNVWEQSMHFWRKGLSYKDVLSHVNNEWHGKATTRYPWWKNGMNWTPRHSVPEKVFVTVTAGYVEQKSRLVRAEQKRLG